ncbi:MAG: ABC transporter permease, partial [Patescibacteria group bacterium]
MKNTRYILIGPFAVLLIWFAITASGLVGPLFLPRLDTTIGKFLSLIGQGLILPDIGMTLYRVFFGFVLATLLGVPLGLLFGLSARLYASFELVIEFFRSLPSTALFPLFLLVFGIGDTAKIAVVVFVSFWIILISTASGVLHSSKTRYRVAQSYGANQWQILTNVTFMEALPQIATGLRVAVSISFIVVVVTEMFIGTNIGLGQRIYDSYLTYRVPELYATLVIVGLLGYVVNKGLILLERKTIHWTGR